MFFHRAFYVIGTLCILVAVIGADESYAATSIYPDGAAGEDGILDDAGGFYPESRQLDFDFITSILTRALDHVVPQWSTGASPIWQGVTHQTSPDFYGHDNNGNGIIDTDHLDALAAIVNGGSSAAPLLESGTISAIQNQFSLNRAAVQQRELTIPGVSISIIIFGTSVHTVTTGGTVSIPVAGSIEIPSLWTANEEPGYEGILAAGSPMLEIAMRDYIAAEMTLAPGEVSTEAAHIQSLVNTFIRTYLKVAVTGLVDGATITADRSDWDASPGPAVDLDMATDFGSVRIVITSENTHAAMVAFTESFNCTNFQCASGNGSLSAEGNLNGSGGANAASFQAANTRQQFLAAEGITVPPLQFLPLPSIAYGLLGGATVIGDDEWALLGGDGSELAFDWETVDALEHSISDPPLSGNTSDITYSLTSTPIELFGDYFSVQAADSMWTRTLPAFPLAMGEAEGEGEGAPDGEGAADGEGAEDGEGLVDGEGVADGEGDDLGVQLYLAVFDVITGEFPCAPFDVTISPGNLHYQCEAEDICLLENVTPGNYIINVIAPGLGAATTQVQVESDLVQTFSLYLFPEYLETTPGVLEYLKDPTYSPGFGSIQSCGAHDADGNGDGKLSLSELLAVVELFNGVEYRCGICNEEPHMPGAAMERLCTPHDLDFSPQDFRISAWELARAVQFFNARGYHCGADGGAVPQLAISHYLGSPPDTTTSFTARTQVPVTVTVTTLDASPLLNSLGVVEFLPPGWSIDYLDPYQVGAPDAVVPAYGSADRHEFVWLDPPIMPFSFTYVARTDFGNPEVVLSGQALGARGGDAGVSATDSLVLTQVAGGPEDMVLERRIGGSGFYTPGDTLEITLTAHHYGPGPLSAFGIVESLPEGWSFLDFVSGAVPPLLSVGSDGVVEMGFIAVPEFPVTLSYRVAVPEAQPGQKTLAGYALYTVGAGGQLASEPVATTIRALGEEEMRLTRELDGGYAAGGTLDITITADYRGGDSLTALGFQERLPPGWTFESTVSGAPPITSESGAGGEIYFLYLGIPENPSITYRVRVPETQTGGTQISGEVLYRTSGDELRSPTIVTEILEGGAITEGEEDSTLRVYVSELTGSDETGDGTGARPWRTITHAVDQVGGIARAAFPVTIQVEEGVYLETVMLQPHLRVVGNPDNPPAKAVIAPRYSQLKGNETGIALEAAEGCEVRNLSIRVPTDAAAWSTAIRILDVSAAIHGCVIDGGLAPESIGVAILNPLSSGTEVADCTITRCFYGIRAIDTSANITRNNFQSIERNAITVYSPATAKGGGTTPEVGTLEEDTATGSNRFGAVNGLFINNLNPATTQAQINYFTVEDPEAIAAKIGGEVDTTYFLRSGALAANFFLTLRNANNQPISGAIITTLPSSSSVIETEQGVYALTLSTGIYSVTVKAPGFVQRTFVRDLTSGGLTQTTEVLTDSTLDPANAHSTDRNLDGLVSLSEMVRVIQLFNAATFHCDGNTEDGYAVGPGDTAGCPRHDVDYMVKDWKISLSELLRLVQFYSLRAYQACPQGASEDGFCAGI